MIIFIRPNHDVVISGGPDGDVFINIRPNGDVFINIRPDGDVFINIRPAVDVVIDSIQETKQEERVQGWTEVFVFLDRLMIHYKDPQQDLSHHNQNTRMKVSTVQGSYVAASKQPLEVKHLP